MIRIKGYPSFVRRSSLAQSSPPKSFSRRLASTLLEGTSREREVAESFQNLPGPGKLENLFNFIRKGGLSNLYRIQCEKFDKFGPIFKEDVLGMKLVHVADAEAHKTVAQTESEFPLRSFYDSSGAKEDHSPLVSLVGNDYERWKRLRTPIAKTFLRPVEVHKFAPGVNSLAIKSADRLRRVLVNGRVVPLKRELDGYGTECIFYSTFGQWMGFYDDPQNTKVLEFIAAACQFNETLFSMWRYGALFRYVKIAPGYKRYLKATKTLDRLIKEFVEVAGTNKREGHRDNMMCSSSLYDKVSGEDSNITDLVFGLSQLGVDNTSFALLWCLYHIARNPEEQENAYQEIVSVIGKASEDSSSKTPQYHGRLPYLTGCIKEALRLNQTALFLPRKLERETTLCGYNIPAKSVVMLWSSYLTTSEKYFKDPGEFRPRRWLKSEGEKKIDPFANLPFGFGTRMCLGRRFSYMTITAFLAHILQNFRLEYIGNEPFKGIYQNWHIPEKELPVKFVERL